MKISCRNQLAGKVREVAVGTIMAKVIVDIGNGQSVTAIITKDAVEDLGVAAGDPVKALIKATSIMLMK
ncbi:MAG: TOBE domain-containing protein [bacterium]|jgi:molybdate transport system regulatory protein